MDSCPNSALGCSFKRVPEVNNESSSNWINGYPTIIPVEDLKAPFCSDLVKEREPSAGVPVWSYALIFTIRTSGVILCKFQPVLWAQEAILVG